VSDAVETVEQLVFRWNAQNRSGATGFGAVAWSGKRDTAENILRTVGPTLEVAGENAVPGLVRMEGKNSVLLGRRTLGRDPGGRAGTICHALLGPKAKLTPPRCLALHAWRWQEDDLPIDTVQERLRPVPYELLTAQLPEEWDRLTDAIRDPGVAQTLVAVTAEVLRNPNRRFSVLDRSDGHDPYAVLWGLYGMFGHLLEDHPLGWSFATHDTDDTKPLRFTFLPDWTAHPSGGKRRVRVDPEQRQENQPEQIAKELVERHLNAAEPETVRKALSKYAPRKDSRDGRSDWLLRTAERALSRIPAAPPEPPEPSYVEHPEAEAEALLSALRLMDDEDQALPGLLNGIEARHSNWSRDLRLRFCRTLLDRRLFLRAWLADTEGERATAVAGLYRWAVRPFAGDPEVAVRLRNILPEELESSRGHPAARAALLQIIQQNPGFPDETWSELVLTALREEPSRRPSPSPSPPVEPTRPLPTAPAPKRAWYPEPPPREPSGRDPEERRRVTRDPVDANLWPERIAIGLIAFVVVVVILLVIWLVTG
jgi:hypothetical protein